MTVSQIFRIFQGVYILGLFSRSAVSTSLQFEVSKASVFSSCLPSNAYYPRTPDYTLCSGVHVCWSEHSDSSFFYGFMSLDYGFGTMTATTVFLSIDCVTLFLSIVL